MRMAGSANSARAMVNSCFCPWLILLASSFKLIIGPLLGALLAIPLGVYGAEYATGVLQLGMPVAISSSVIAIEFDLAPNFVVTTVLFSTLASLLTLTILLALV